MSRCAALCLAWAQLAAPKKDMPMVSRQRDDRSHDNDHCSSIMGFGFSPVAVVFVFLCIDLGTIAAYKMATAATLVICSFGFSLETFNFSRRCASHSFLLISRLDASLYFCATSPFQKHDVL